MFLGPYASFFVPLKFFDLRDFYMPYGPQLYGILWGHIFANMGGGGGQNCFQKRKH